MVFRTASVFLLLALLIVVRCAAATENADSNRQPDELIVFKTAGERELKLHVFRPDAEDRESRSPAILFFFGGGWNGGTPTQFYPQSEYFADLGLIAICAEYRTQTSDAVPPLVSLMDAKSAMRYLRSHAEELGIDPAQIAAGGGSAGGHLAAALTGTDLINDADDDISVSTRPDALILYNPVIDNGPDGFGYERVAPYWESFSPLHNVADDHPPTIFFLGTEDHLIPVSTAIAYKNAVEAAGARMELHLYDGAKHGFFNRFRSIPNYEDTTHKAHDFLQSRGFIE